MELLILPDELLLMILKNVSSNDLLSVARTCKRFSEITADWRLVSCLNFRYETMLRCDLLRHFVSNIVRTNMINTIDFTSCYWLSSTFLLNVLLRLRNVENILVADTSLSFNHLKRILSNITTVKRLSWSWEKGAGSSGIESALSNLSFLYLCVHEVDQIAEVSSSSFLTNCVNLKELWVVSACFHPDSPVILQKKVSEVEKLVVSHTEMLDLRPASISGLTHVWTPHYKPLSVIKNLEAFHAHTSDMVEIVCSSNFDSLRRLSILKLPKYLNLEVFLGQMPGLVALHLRLPSTFPETILSGNSQLEELSLSCEIGNQECCTSYCHSASLCPSLKRLVLPVQALVCAADDSHPVPSTSSSRRKVRISHVKLPVPEGTVTPFKKMIRSTPHIEEFEVGPVSRHVIPSLPPSLHWDLNSLADVVEWKKLSSLTLANLPIVNGKVFEPILRGCKSLKSLKVLNLGPLGKCNYSSDLYSALKYSTMLKDFEWEQPNVGSTSRLWEALSEIKSLQRLAVRNCGVSELCERGILHFLQMCSAVMFLLVVTSATQTRCASLKRGVRESWRKTRPALIAQFISTSGADFTKHLLHIPAVHLGEMWTRKSRISNLPSSSPSFLSFRFTDPVPWAPHV